MFNESVVANEEGLRQLGFVLETLGVELVVTHSPGWYDSIGEGSIGTSHMDMVCMVPDERVIVLAPHLVNYGFVRWLMERDYRIVEVPRRRVLGPRGERRHARAREGRDQPRLADGRRGARAARTSR